MKVWLQRTTLLVMISVAIAFVLVSYKEKSLVEGLRTSAMDTFAPVLDAVSAPIEGIAEIVGSVHELAVLRDESARLRIENERLLKWESMPSATFEPVIVSHRWVFREPHTRELVAVETNRCGSFRFGLTLRRAGTRNPCTAYP